MIETTIAMFGMPGGIEWIAIGIVALLLFGRRLPDVARSLGKSIVEFKKGIKDVKDEIDIRRDLEDKSSKTARTPKQISSTENPPNEKSNSDSVSEPTDSTDASSSGS